MIEQHGPRPNGHISRYSFESVKCKKCGKFGKFIPAIKSIRHKVKNKNERGSYVTSSHCEVG